MENRIYQMKDKLLGKIEEEMQDMSRMDVKEVGELADAVHHLAEAEYYCSIADAMWAEKHGYTPTDGMRMPMSQTRRGYTEAPMRPGYTSGGDDIVSKLGEEFRNLPHEEKMMMRNKVLSALGSM